VTIRGNCRTAQVLDARNLDEQKDLLLCAALDLNDANDAGPLDQNPVVRQNRVGRTL
jgi:hypothetical protein